jgi:hypothetical protein
MTDTLEQQVEKLLDRKIEQALDGEYAPHGSQLEHDILMKAFRAPLLAAFKALSEAKDSILLVPTLLDKLGDLDDDGGEPECSHTHPLKNIVSGTNAHCYGAAIAIDEVLALLDQDGEEKRNG